MKSATKFSSYIAYKIDRQKDLWADGNNTSPKHSLEPVNALETEIYLKIYITRVLYDKNTFFVLSYKAPETGTNTLRMHTLRRGENQHVDLAARLFVSGEYKHRLFITFSPGRPSVRVRLETTDDQRELACFKNFTCNPESGAQFLAALSPCCVLSNSSWLITRRRQPLLPEPISLLHHFACAIKSDARPRSRSRSPHVAIRSERGDQLISITTAKPQGLLDRLL